MMSPQFVAGDQLSAQQVYAIWRMRDAVFSVEQNCTIADVDGLDLLTGTTHVWLEDEEGLTSYLRSYTKSSVRRFGRVATRANSRGRGLSGRIIDAVHARWPDEVIQIGAQAHLEAWYESFGYRRCGPNFTEAGIDHVPMRRVPATAAKQPAEGVNRR